MPASAPRHPAWAAPITAQRQLLDIASLVFVRSLYASAIFAGHEGQERNTRMGVWLGSTANLALAILTGWTLGVDYRKYLPGQLTSAALGVASLALMAVFAKGTNTLTPTKYEWGYQVEVSIALAAPLLADFEPPLGPLAAVAVGAGAITSSGVVTLAGTS